MNGQSETLDQEQRKNLDSYDDDPDSPYIYVDGKKELKDGSGMIKESAAHQHKGVGHVRRTS